MTSRSRVEASAWSRATASVPATWLSGSGVSAARRARTVSAAASEPGAASMTASISATPLPWLTMRAPAMPSTPVAAAVTACGSAVVTMIAGSALPAGNDWARRSLAEMASGFCRNWSEVLRPVSMKSDAGRHAPRARRE